jgi:hypothetical protein
MTTNTSLRHVAAVSVAAVSIVSLAACGSSSKSPAAGTGSMPSTPTSSAPSLSLTQRVAEAKVCASVFKEFSTAAPIFTKLTSRQVTVAQALTELRPVAAKIDALAMANASLPIGPALTKLSTDIAEAQKAKTSNASAIKAEVMKLEGDGTTALKHCA